ncbi:hypothetical protein PAECIP111893_00909 [Paenibacillus plantiphilus]|uniref:DUF58 domain-containing protein n=1 Tax=Paenibacillus plantiphilus TaxID=2905650 RepID=A0ABN8G2R4_9BACL|nr:DUF58 domain-containing protein [Paenibacillus plantiphilus]CAH1197719.1 hypothetical protein PAECIP111893_00909 [Paenibacillus plantiphilus]
MSDHNFNPPSAESARRELLLDPALLERLSRLSIVSKNRIRGTIQGKRRSRSLGSSLEFADYRPYAPGDDIRRIDWNVYGRSGRAFVRQYWDEQELLVHMYVDVSRSMSFDGRRGSKGEHSPSSGQDKPAGQDGSKLRYALRLAAAVGYLSLAGEDRVSVKLFSDEIKSELPPLRGRVSAMKLLRYLTDADNSEAVEQTAHHAGNDDLSAAIVSAAGLPRRAGQTWLFTDGLYEHGIERTISSLIGAGQEVVFVHILSPEELRPALQGELKLIDSEQGTGKDVAIGANVLQAYKQAVAEHCERIRGYCGQRGAVYLLLDSGLPLEQAVVKLLQESGLMR